jgi:lysine 2,3-aminomutase
MDMDGAPPRRRAARDAEALLREGLIAPEDREITDRIALDFRIRVSPAMLAAMEPGLATQFVPDARELVTRPEELADPIGDRVHAHGALTHRYPDRAILHATQTCEVYCRFCFRRETVGDTGTLAEAEFAAALTYLAAHPAIREVIFTGGDPLTLSPRRLDDWLTRLTALPQIEVIRFHTRIPVVAPEKITDDLLAALDRPQAVFLVVHTNHPAELTETAIAALRRLNRAGVALLSQTVLLNGVNADPDTLETLFRALIRARVKPYYLHHCDLAKGTSHFRTTIAEGQAIMATLRARLSGIAQPTYVLDIPGGHGKVPIGPGYLTETAPSQWQVIDPQGQTHAYRDPA